VLDRQAGTDGRPDAAAERNERLRALYKHLETLSDRKRTVLVLHDLAGLPASEIAEIVEAPVLTVRTRLFYARKELYAALASDPALAEVVAPRAAAAAAADDGPVGQRDRAGERLGHRILGAGRSAGGGVSRGLVHHHWQSTLRRSGRSGFKYRCRLRRVAGDHKSE
ncbi:MAG: RNA polymerase sigma factor, partial [Pseudonocardiaceae bacterium]